MQVATILNKNCTNRGAIAPTYLATMATLDVQGLISSLK